MKSKDEIEDRIAKYMVGELNEAEKESFLREVKEDPDLEERLKAHQMIVAKLKESEKEKLRAQLRGYIPLTKKRKRNPYLVAASIIIPLSCLWLWNYRMNQFS